MVENVTILVGTMTGTAELVAEEMLDVLEGRGVDAEIKMMDGLDAGAFADGGAFVLCVSTYGQGNVPDNAQGLLESLEKSAPDLSAVRYGLFALGDMTYAKTFCFGGKMFDQAMTAAGAARVGEAKMHDASSGDLPEDEAGIWIEGWLDLLADAEAA